MQVVETGPEESAGLVESFHSPVNQELDQNLVNAELGGKGRHLLAVR